MTAHPRLHHADASACAKIILCGEHAVVYGRPAIALPLPHLRTYAEIRARHGRLEIRATDINHVVYMPTHPPTQQERPHPLALIAYLTCEHLRVRPPQALLTIRSDFPVGSNLGSGAAVSIAVARCLAAYFRQALSPEAASELAFVVERQHHGTPSGIDNTVIAYEQAVRFVKGEAPQVLRDVTVRNLPVVIGDSGESTPTRVPVGVVRAAWEAEPARLEARFDAIAEQVRAAHAALSARDLPDLGAAMNANHALLRQLNVSSEMLDRLCDSARAAGAWGAKMSGGGRGGNMLALARDAAHAIEIGAALQAAGARRVFIAPESSPPALDAA